nr:DUF4175 domain-containing protein [Loktanella sp. IMCC34160]
MVAEQVVRAFWPLWTVLFVAVAPLLLGWQDALPVELVWAFGVLCLLAAVVSLVRGVRVFRWPARAEAVARVDATLPGRPIATLTDRQVIGAGDAASEAVWRAHVARMQDRTRAARMADPDLRLSKVDPFGLRYIALLFFVVALMFGSVWRVQSVTQMGPGAGQSLVTGPTWEGWIAPPAYTGKPTLYLADIPQGPLRVPEGSEITLRFYGEIGALTLAETVSARSGDDLPPASDPSQVFIVMQDGTLSINGEGGAEWQVSVIPDTPPTVELTGPVAAEADGEMSQPFLALDDYGVVSGSATIALDLDRVDRRHGLAIPPEVREALVLDLPMPFTGDRRDFEEMLTENLSEHPFANLPVTLTLEVQDSRGQVGRSDPEPIILPGRRFFQPVARAVIEQRRDLLWSRDNGRRILQILRAVAHRPEELFDDDTSYLRLSFTLRRLAPMVDEGLTVEQQDEIAQALWDLAVQLEEGTLADARERLRRAQERLAEAMRNGATPEEIEELMQELRDATNDYMRMLAEQAQPQDDNGTDQPDRAEQDALEFTMDELQALMDRIQELMEEGRMAEAQELMEQLNELMENLQVTQGDGGGDRMPGEQSMQDLSDTLRDQQDLSDDAFSDLQEGFNRGEGRQDQPQDPGQDPGQQGQRPGQQPRDGESGEGQGFGQDSQQGQQNDQGQGGEGDQQSLADRQEALRQELERQLGNLPSLDGDSAEAARRALERAEDAMDGAEDALREGDLAEAIDQQAEAMDALRDGLRNLGDALAQNRREEEPGQGQQDGNAQGRLEPSRRDPLGRQLGNNGQFGTEEDMLQGQELQRRAEELLQELRRRSSEQDRPQLELDYLKRLLERF